MRKLAPVILAFFVTAFLVGAVVPHCVPGLDESATNDKLARLAQDDSASHHGGLANPDDDVCVIAGDLTPGNVVVASAISAPRAKATVQPWPVPSVAQASSALAGGQVPTVRINAQAPPYAVAFARTNRLLI